jgi:hypothetical protein
MKTKIQVSVMGIAVLLVLIGAVPAAVDAAAVKVVPASQAVHAGENFSVNITIENVTNMKTDQARLYFDSSAMNATDVIEGDFLKTGGTTLPIEKIDNTEGFAGFAYTLLSGTPVTGSGVLATIKFNTSEDIEGTFNLNLTNVMIKNETTEIPVDVYNGTISMDNTSPTVEIISPANGDWFGSEAVNLTFLPRDNLAEMLNYLVFLNEEEVANGTAANCSEEIVYLGTLSEGSYVLSVNVTDNAGLTGSDEIMIYVDRAPPNVEIISPENDDWFDSENVVLTFLPCDNQADVLNFSIFDNGTEVANGTATNCSTKEVNLGVLSESDHVIKVEVADKAGKTNSSEVTIHVDLTPPVITIKSPEEGKNYPGVCVRLNFTAEDLKSGINEIVYNLDGTGNITITGNTTICGLTPYNHSIIVYAKDKVDKVNYSGVHFTVHPGDISVDLSVDIDDLEDLADAFFSKPGDPNWKENADLNCDSEVDIDDLEILADYFFKSY